MSLEEILSPGYSEHHFGVWGILTRAIVIVKQLHLVTIVLTEETRFVTKARRS